MVLICGLKLKSHKTPGMTPQLSLWAYLTDEVTYIFFFFILLASPKKNKQTSKQKNRQTNRKNVGRDTATAVAYYSGPG